MLVLLVLPLVLLLPLLLPLLLFPVDCMTIVETVELVTGLGSFKDLEASFEFDMVAVVLDLMEEFATMTLVVMELILPPAPPFVTTAGRMFIEAACDGGVTGE